MSELVFQVTRVQFVSTLCVVGRFDVFWVGFFVVILKAERGF